MPDNSDQLHIGYRQFLASINTAKNRTQLDPELKAKLGVRVLAGPVGDEEPHQLVLGGAGGQKTVTAAEPTEDQELTPVIAGYPDLFRDLMAAEEASLRRALAQSAAGNTEDLGDFTQYAV